MRRQDAFGIERPSSVDRIAPRITPPEGGDLYKPVRIPRPFLGARAVVYDIQDQTVRYTGDNGRSFPTFGETRGFSDFPNLLDLTPPSEQRPSPPLRTRTTVNALQTATEAPNVIPRAQVRDRTLIQPPHELHHSSEPPLRNPITAMELASPTAITAAAVLPHVVLPDEAESVESIAESIRGIHMRALHRNSSLMYQRLTFSLTRFPAIVLVLMALWTLWGRGEGLPTDLRPKQEKGADIAALVTGAFLLISQVFLLHQHYNSYSKAKIMSYLYHITMLLAFCGAAVALVFAATSFTKLKKLQYSDTLDFSCKVSSISDPDHPNVPHNWLCLTKNQRIDYMGVVIGSSALVMILAVFTMIAGAIGQFVMADRLASEYKNIVVNNETPVDEYNEHF